MEKQISLTLEEFKIVIEMTIIYQQGRSGVYPLLIDAEKGYEEHFPNHVPEWSREFVKNDAAGQYDNKDYFGSLTSFTLGRLVENQYLEWKE